MFRRSPEVTVTKLTQDKVEFTLRNTDTSVANALRRVMIGETPTICIDTVIIHENTSVLPDEYIAHRLGLVPLRVVETVTSVDAFQWPQRCECTGRCGRCTVMFEIVAEHTPELGESALAVTSRHMHAVYLDHAGEVLRSADGTPVDDPRIQPAHFASEQEEATATDDGIALLALGRGQRIRLTAFAVKGIGKEHAKWSPVAVATYKFDPIVTLDEARINADMPERARLDLARSCPRNVFAFLPASRAVVLDNPQECIFCRECIHKMEDYRTTPEEALPVTVRHSSDTFHFTVESTGALAPAAIVRSALVVLAEKLHVLKTAIERDDRR